jgi:hypothetical protein
LITSIENQTSIFSPQLGPFGFPPLGWAWFRRLTFGPDRRTARAIATQAMTAARLCVDQIAGDGSIAFEPGCWGVSEQKTGISKHSQCKIAVTN